MRAAAKLMGLEGHGDVRDEQDEGGGKGVVVCDLGCGDGELRK